MFVISLPQAVGQDLVNNEVVLEAVNQEAFDLMEELRQGEGLVDMQGFEEQLRLVNAKWNEAKAKVWVKIFSVDFPFVRSFSSFLASCL